MQSSFLGHIQHETFILSTEISSPGGVCSDKLGTGTEIYYFTGVVKERNTMSGSDTSFEFAILGGGCFWCVEAVYKRIAGVKSVVSGYAGGAIPNPNYNQVSDGTTGHAEVVKVEFDPGMISYAEVLKIFFKSHDPTTKNRQGNDVGTQYRSIILYENDDQRQIALEARTIAQADFDDGIVTEIEPLKEFYDAEDYHQDYFDNNLHAGYCRLVIAPKLQKLGL